MQLCCAIKGGCVPILAASLWNLIDSFLHFIPEAIEAKGYWDYWCLLTEILCSSTNENPSCQTQYPEIVAAFLQMIIPMSISHLNWSNWRNFLFSHSKYKLYKHWFSLLLFRILFLKHVLLNLYVVLLCCATKRQHGNIINIVYIMAIHHIYGHKS